MRNNKYQNIPSWASSFDLLPDAWLAVARDGEVWQFNPQVPPMLGAAATDLVGKKLSCLLKRVEHPSLGGLADGAALCTPLRGVRTGAMIRVEEIPCPLPGWDGRLLHLVDLSESLEIDAARIRKLDRLTALVDIMTMAESDRQRWLDQAMELGARALGLELGVVNHIHGGIIVLLAHNAPGLLHHAQTCALDQSYSSLVADACDVVALPSLLDSPYAHLACYQNDGYQAFLGAPLWVHGERYGAMCFCSKLPRQTPFDRSDLVFVKLLARWVGGIVERMNVERRLRESHGELEEQVELLAMAEKVARLGHWRLDMHLRTMLLSDEAHAFLGLPLRSEWGLGEFEALIATEDRDAWREQLHACVDDGNQLGLELRMINADGCTRWLSVRGMRLEQYQQHQLFGVMLDITDSKQAQETILFQASHDALTGLINRVLLFDRLGQEIRRCQRTSGHFAVLFIDLDYFKVINDSYGHEAGDRVLVQVAKRLSAALRKSDTVGRFGGDEFIAIIAGAESYTLLQLLIKKILHKLEAPILFGKDELFISASIGVALYPSEATLPQDLVRQADRQMYLVKEQRKQLIQLPHPGKRASKSSMT